MPNNKKKNKKKNDSTSPVKTFKKRDILIISLILLIAFFFRLYKINTSLTDHHSWRQADTASVARTFVRSGFDLLHPRYHDLSNIQSGLDNPQGYRFVEFPLYNALFALLYKYIPIFPLEVYGRLVTSFFSLITIVCIYLLVLKEEDRIAATVASLVFAVFPFFVFFSRVVLPDMTALSLTFVSLLFLYIHLERRENNRSITTWLFYGISLIAMAFAILIKPTTIFYYIPVVYLFFKTYSFALFKKIRVYFYGISLVPLVLWRIWMVQFKEGIPFASWLLTQVNTPQGRQTIFFRPAFFRWIFEERILLLILGGYLTALVIVGIVKKHKKSLFFHSIGITSLVYLFVFQGGNVQHDYYQILILPPLAIFAGLGTRYIIYEKKTMGTLFIKISLLVFVFCASFLFSLYRMKGFYATNSGLVSIGKIVNTLTEKDAKIATDTTGDTTLLYLADRKGYPAPTKEFKDLEKDGIVYFVTMKKEAADSLKKTYPIIFENDTVYILKLVPGRMK
ncbi:MAG TPA: glycosyltransferase family 39 protein [Patescibacteria group bacterium]|nr:glycosyltransferase family 39 protein [Patescibacteria group bacterium]